MTKNIIIVITIILIFFALISIIICIHSRNNERRILNHRYDATLSFNEKKINIDKWNKFNYGKIIYFDLQINHNNGDSFLCVISSNNVFRWLNLENENQSRSIILEQEIKNKPIVTNSRILLSSSKQILCYDKFNKNSLQWKFPKTIQNYDIGEMTLKDDIVYVGSSNGVLHSINIESGLDSPINLGFECNTTNIVMDNQNLYLAVAKPLEGVPEKSIIVSIDLIKKEIIWKYSTTGIQKLFLLKTNLAFSNSDLDEIHFINKANGNFVSFHKLDTFNAKDLYNSSDTFYIVDKYNLKLFDAEGLKSDSQTIFNDKYNLFCDSDNLYFNTTNAFYSCNKSTLKEKWYLTPNYKESTIIFSYKINNNILIVFNDGTIQYFFLGVHGS